MRLSGSILSMRWCTHVKRITTTQFVWSAVFLTLWCISWILQWSNLGLFCLLISGLITTSRGARTRPLPAKHIVAYIGGVALVWVGLLLLGRVIPDQWEKPVERVMYHPALVVPLWAAMIFSDYLAWRYGKTETDAV